MNIAKFILFYLLFSSVGMASLCFFPEVSLFSLWLHLFFVSGIVALLIFLISIVKSNYMIKIIAVVFSFFILLQLLLYIANLILFKINSVLVDKAVLMTAYKYVGLLFFSNNFKFYFVFSLTVIALIFLFFVLCFLLNKTFSNCSFKKITRVFSLFWFLVVVLTAVLSYEKAAFNVWSTEPLFGVFRDNRVVFNTDHRINKKEEDEKEMESYFSSYSGKTNRNRKNVIIVVSDALRYDMIGPDKKQSPFVSEMIRQEKITFYDNSYSPCPSSTCGILGILSSKRYGDLTFSSIKIHDVLKLYGYRIKFFLSGIHSGWIDALDELYGLNIDEKYTSNVENGTWVDDEEIITDFKENILNAGQPFFAYVHLMTTHFVGIKHEPMFKPTLIKPNIFTYATGGYAKERVINRYKNGVFQLDTYLEEIFSSLEKQGVLENTIIIVTGDHGDGLGEKGVYSHSKNLSTYQIRVPILIYGIEDKLYQHTHISALDITTTILDTLGILKPKSWQGASLLEKQKKEKCSYHEQQFPYRSRFALICSYPDKNKVYRYEVNAMGMKYLYDLSLDVEENHNLLGMPEYRKIENEMRSTLKDYIDQTSN